MIVGSYVLHLYCDGDNHPKFEYGPAEFSEETRREAMRAARKSGWRLRGEKAYCCKCKPTTETQGVLNE